MEPVKTDNNYILDDPNGTINDATIFEFTGSAFSDNDVGQNTYLDEVRESNISIKKDENEKKHLVPDWN